MTAHSIRRFTGIFLVLLALPIGLAAQQPWAALDDLGDQLRFSTESGDYSAQFGGVANVDYYLQNNNRTFGWVFPRKGRDYLLSPRLSLTLDAQATKFLYAFVKYRWDDGLHPGLAEAAPMIYKRSRWDEYFLRVQLPDGTANLQVGRFAPQLGNFLGRHDAWDNPLITYPAVYEQTTSASDSTVFKNAAQFQGNKFKYDNPIFWVADIWAPYYAQGASIFGEVGQFGYAVSYMNSAPCTRSQSWNNDYNLGTWIGRVTFTPNPAWKFGTSVAHGPYYREDAIGFDPGKTREDYNQTLVGFDVRYEQGKLQLWGEVFWNRFEIPAAGNADNWAYYVEAKYKLTRQWFLAVRWNHQLFVKLNGQKWDNDLYRAEAGVGYRFNNHLQAKLQYSRLHHDADFQNVEHLLAAQLALKF